ncbi:MAG: imidazolonepropionase [Epsilonproteobacteria bacterium]|nr:MAG: imidazolonepropionase [Campylobacterota bacterium]RLA67575.1 MAG: imidazolonepropionase [Campylobacterota bacterium]
MQVFRNFSQIITLDSAFAKDGRNLVPKDLSIISNASVVFDDKEILWVGKDIDFPAQYQVLDAKDCSGKILFPELVDCHTHLVFGGDRSNEYAMRLNGAGYEEIAKTGGGIISTMKKTSTLSRDELFNLGCERIERINSYGIGTIEIKSGYGLNLEKEKELTLIIDDLKKKFAEKVQIKNTYMAAHAVPPGFSSSKDYLDDVVIPLLKDLAPQGIIDAVDIFYEKGYFTHEDCEELFKVSKELKIPCKGHMDEFYDNKGALLGVKYNALSVDHLLNTDLDGIKALASSKTVTTLLPGTGFFLGVNQANARAFLDAGCKVAIGSDYNPGSCHWDNVLMIASMAAPKYEMNLAELWASITLNAAHALGLTSQGVIKKGFSPRFTIFATDSVDQITYNWGKNFSLS